MTTVLQGDVKVPIIGKTKKVWIYVPAGIAGAYVVYRWYRASREEEPEPGVDGLYSTPDLTELGLSTTGGPTVIGGNTGSTVTDGTNPNAIDTNAEWTSKAVELLGNAGYEGTTVYAALGEFLARRGLDPSEATIVRAALAAAGQPPEGRPWSVIEEAATGTTTLPAPGGLKVAPTHNQATVSWSAVPGAASYRLYRNDQSTASPQSVAGTSLIMYNLDPGRTYKVWVAAVSSSGKEGTKSGQVTFSTGLPKLTAPAGLKATRVERTQVTVSYSPVAGAAGYVGFRTGAYVGAAQSDGTTMTIGGLRSNTTYLLSVAARAGTGNKVGPKSSIKVKTKK